MEKIVQFNEHLEAKKREENFGYTDEELDEEFEELCGEKDPREDTDPYMLEMRAAEAENELRRLNGLPPKYNMAEVFFDILARIGIEGYAAEALDEPRKKAEIIPFGQVTDT